MKNRQKHRENIIFFRESVIFCEGKSDKHVKKSKSLTSLFSKVRREQFAHGRKERKSEEQIPNPVKNQ